ncbi:MFS transporter [Enterobacteriaceae bacterium BIT-l23]|uniref:MFS transporter n=1 Tax=Jejubacter sp. L23 TaxID=3092086 RepID=UPI001584718D|nr:MFS transporter [Enterobacteriaceae bacterium BIT-l23]
MSRLPTGNDAQWLGMPLRLTGGYIALFLFMAGDGFELAFLSKYIVSLGFPPASASLVIAVYGLVAALAAWGTGVVAEILTPQKTMKIGLGLWLIFHVLFLWLGLHQANYPLMIFCYAIRGIAYPLFCYGFLMMIIHQVKKEQVAAASGWFWAAYSLGIGVIGSALPGLMIPWIGEFKMLWVSLLFVALGGGVALVTLRNVTTPESLAGRSHKERLRELPMALTLLSRNRNIALSFVVRIINQLAVFGFSVVMPFQFVRVGFTLSQWLQTWAVFFASTIVFNIFWGVLAERLGLLRIIRWFGCVGCAVACLAFYHVPLAMGPNMLAAVGCALALGFFMSAFVPMTALFPALEPHHKGAAISVYNLAAGLSNFVGPAIATLALPGLGVQGVVYIYSALYLGGAVLTLFIGRQPERVAQIRGVTQR